MKTPEEIKKIELALIDFETTCGHCPYEGEPNGCNRPGGTCKMLDVVLDAAEAINQLEAQQPRWISVKEREPEPYVSVLGYIPDEAPMPVVREGYRVSPGNRNAYYFPVLADYKDITHWMEMPKPPKEDT